jgi:hypothetical protein
VKGRHPFTLRRGRAKAGGSGGEWRHAVGGRGGGGGPTAVVREWRSRVAAGRRYSIEQGSGGH